MVGPIDLVNHLHLWQSKPNMLVCQKYKINHQSNQGLNTTLYLSYFIMNLWNILIATDLVVIFFLIGKKNPIFNDQLM